MTKRKFKFFSTAHILLAKEYNVDLNLNNSPNDLKNKVFEYQNECWRKSAYKNGHSCLRYFCAKPETKGWKHVDKSEFQKTKLLTQLRLDWDFLNATGFRYKKIRSNECPVCKEKEDRRHFLLHCKRYTVFRNIMFQKIKAVIGQQVPITLKLLLGGGNFSLSKKDQIQDIVMDFILITKRHKEGFLMVLSKLNRT